MLHAGVYLADTFLLLVCLFVNYLRVSVCACEKKDRQVTTANLQHHAAQRYNKTARQRYSDTDTDTRLDKWPSVSARLALCNCA